MLRLFNQLNCRTNLRSLLVFPFVCQILIVLGVVSYLSYRSSQKALQEITNNLQQEIILRIDSNINGYLEEGNHLNQVNNNNIIFNPSLINNLQELGRFFVYQYRWNNTANIIGFARQDGSYVEVSRQPSGDFHLVILEQKEGQSNQLSTYLINTKGDILKTLSVEKNSEFDPRESSWYQETVKNNPSGWQNIYQTKLTNQLVIASSRVIYNSDQEFIGVLTNNIRLGELSLFLNQLKVGKTGAAFILDRKGRLIADSIKFSQGTLEEEERFLFTPATTNNNPYIRNIAEYLKKKNLFSKSLENSLVIDLAINQEKILIDVIPFNNQEGIDWLIVLVIPESDFTGFIRANTRVSLSLSILAIIIATISGLITSKVIIQPIINLKNASQKISQGKFNQKIPSQGIQELDSLAQYFNHMSEMLESIFNNLNKSLQDVSNLKYAIDQSAIVTITDPEGIIIYSNDKLVEVSGYSYEELIGTKTKKLKSGCHSQEFYHQLWTTISQGKVWRGEIKNKTKNNRFYWVDTTIVPLTDEKGNILQYLSIQTEITERKKLEKNLEQIVQIRTHELAQANEEITLLNQRLCSENLQLTGKLKLLHQMQQLILPKKEELEKIHCLDIAGYSEPTDELGGDYYDILADDNSVTIGIGDVTGHGLESGILMVMTQAAICTLKHLGDTNPIDFLDILNRAIFFNVRRMKSEKNLSLAIINYCQGEVCIAGQHEEIIIVRNHGEIELIDTIDLGLPIGIDEDIKEFINYHKITLDKGDGIVLYTDGITEARDVNKNQYGIERLCQVVSENWNLSCEQIRDIIIDDVKRFIGLQKIEDDLTLLLLKQR
ncbi:SpoIIE family protein phosphatase [Cyanobacterium aponinum AL20118]|uniref:SpoIIE family protein phosphatase n=1 Tax=Cyanobacterium aponinum AL20115 TaxID=3090662 RepID=A0AAF1C5M7_9CHRO|nr:SpoIIE family protein phosphatase [Cyanobacterium aponinum]WPF87429.1 SpoIIE family protein phosphatase [Cyanobacterium aponinum AL20115]